MVPNITAILQRFTGEWTKLLQPEAIPVCHEIGYTLLRLGHGFHYGADGFLRRQSRDGVLHRVDNLGLHRVEVGCGGRLA
jgi:hypothetical protein